MTEQSKLAKTISTACLACTQILLLGSGAMGLSSQAALAADQVGAAGDVPAAKVAASPGSSDDERILRDQAVDYAKLYAARDAKALAAMWASDGTFTDSRGEEHIGRGAIETYFRDGFREGRPQTLDVTVSSVKFPAPGVAIEEGTTRIASGPGLGSMGRYLVVHTKSNGQWQMQSVSETDCSAKSNGEYLKDLDWLVGSWSIKKQPDAAHLKVSWSRNRSFIFCRYVKGDEKDAPLEELQIIGWDPQSAQIVAWHFGASGGFGHGTYSCDGKSWIEHAAATEPDGKAGRARYKLTRLDNNSFTWQSTKRFIAGQALPDSDEFTVTRDN
jgi:uncharacterized protein (TIGR02246 family)